VGGRAPTTRVPWGKNRCVGNKQADMSVGKCSTLSVVFTAGIAAVHIGIWAFVLLAFVDERTARFNVMVLIPLIFIAHMLPFHVLTEAKRHACKGWKAIDDLVINTMVLPRLVKDAASYTEAHCFQSPLSTQGMMIFGALSSAWRVM